MSEQQPESNIPVPPGPKQITIDMPREVPIVYSNVALISHTPVEVVLDFAQVLPRTPRGTVQARIIMTPMHAKMLQLALAQNVQNYEKQFGQIRIPSQSSPLVDDFFRFSTEGGKQQD
ncbi:MAG: DUF3467 domain-containing protein [Anaerolinea sp.]|nr:DUF3467 domain-containing protein [Anaerolinea sp.]